MKINKTASIFLRGFMCSFCFSVYAEGELNILADEFVYDMDAHTMEYSGNVDIKSDRITIIADYVRLIDKAPNDRRFTASGSPVDMNFVHLDTTGEKKPVEIQGKDIDLLVTPEDKSVSILGQGFVSFERNTIKSDTIYYSMQDNFIQAKRDPTQVDNSRVEITIPNVE